MMSKMFQISCTLILTVFFITGNKCLPPGPQRFNVLAPEEINSLEDESSARSLLPPGPRNPNSIEDTVKEVQDIIKSNPALPRLTRGEILDLLENITSEDVGKKRDPKAIMVVMPFTPTNTDDKTMEDLYTKAPVTHLIGDKKENNKTRRRPPVKFTESEEKKKFEETPKTRTTTPLRRRRPEVTTERMSTTYYPPTQRSRQEPSTYHPRRPIRRRSTTTLAPNPKHPNHRYPEEFQFSPSEGIRIIESPKLVPQSLHHDLDPQENIVHEVVVKHSIPIAAAPSYTFSTTTSRASTTSPTTSTSTTRSSTTTTTSHTEDINLPESLKSLMKDMNLEAALNPKVEDPKPTKEEQNKIKGMLASIGVFPSETTTSTTTTSMPNAENVADSLSPEMRDLLMSFGLLPNPEPKTEEMKQAQYNPEKAEVEPESYAGFKPLPEDSSNRDDMEALLSSFGLGRNARKNKAIPYNNNPSKDYNLDMIPEDMKGILANIGLTPQSSQRQEKKIRAPPLVKTEEKQHVFNPDTQYASQSELKKLERLIDMIRQLEKMNGSASEADIAKIDLVSLKELVGSLNGKGAESLEEKGSKGPDPNLFDLGIIKNEVKRQEVSSTTTTEAAPSSAVIKDLEDSFGGKIEVTTEAIPETTAAPKTGFYYLVDWNTFLDIDDTKGRRVNLRFQPTIGDPKRFLSIAVP